jgi:signal peptidase
MAVQVLGAGVTEGATSPRRRGIVLPAAGLALAMLLCAALGLGAAALAGWRLHAIRTDSMAPAYPAGSLAVVEPVGAEDLRRGMTVVFEDPLSPRRLIAHRLVKRLPSSSIVWQTKGDANAEADPAPVAATAMQGRVRWAIPRLGGALSGVGGLGAALLLVGTPLALLLLTELTALRQRGRSA